MRWHGWLIAGALALVCLLVAACAGGQATPTEVAAPAAGAPQAASPADTAAAAAPQDAPFQGAEGISPDGAGAAEESEPEADDAVAEIDPDLLLGPPLDPTGDENQRESEPVAQAAGAAGPQQGVEDDDDADAVESTGGQRQGRSDGRPVWWLEQPKVDAGVVTLAAEALARDIREARRAAVQAGAAALRRWLGGEPQDMRVIAATVRPLRESAGAADMRFVGYVLVSAEADGSLAER